MSVCVHVWGGRGRGEGEGRRGGGGEGYSHGTCNGSYVTIQDLYFHFFIEFYHSHNYKYDVRKNSLHFFCSDEYICLHFYTCT